MTDRLDRIERAIAAGPDAGTCVQLGLALAAIEAEILARRTRLADALSRNRVMLDRLMETAALSAVRVEEGGYALAEFRLAEAREAKERRRRR